MKSNNIINIYNEKYSHIKLQKPNKFLLRNAIFDYKLIDEALFEQLKYLDESDYRFYIYYFFEQLDLKEIEGANFQYLSHPKYKEVFLNYFKNEKVSNIIDFYLEGLGSIEKDVEKILIKKISKLEKEELLIFDIMELDSKKREKLKQLLEKERKEISLKKIKNYFIQKRSK